MISHRSLLTTHCLLFTVCCSLFTAHCSLITVHASSVGSPPVRVPVGDEFTIGVYYAVPTNLEVAGSKPGKHTCGFGWDYAFMDMARHGVNFIVPSGTTEAKHWASIKHWGMKGFKHFGVLGDQHSYEYPGPGLWKPADLVAEIEELTGRWDGYLWNDEYVGDVILGHVMADEPECGDGKTADQRDFIRTWADIYHQFNPSRVATINHCDPPWYDLHQKKATCSIGATICVNSHRVVERVAEAKKIGHDGMTLVALPGSLGGWIAPKCENVNYYGFGPCNDSVQEWLKDRTTYLDVYEEMIAAYAFGADGFTVFLYNYAAGYAVALVDTNGVSKGDGRWDGFGDAANDIRRAQGWPGVELLHEGKPVEDRGEYAAGEIQLTARAVSDSGAIAKVIFGKSINGGSDWESAEDDMVPYEVKFQTRAGEMVIFRAQAVDTGGRKSIYAANMIYVK